LDDIDKILGFVLLVAGPCILIYSVVSFVRTRSFLRCCVEVDGEVKRLERSKSSGKYGYTYAPVFSFTVADGQTYTVTSEVSTSPPGFDVGESVRVRYDPSNPEDARIHTFFQTWGGAVMWGIVGAAFIAFGFYWLGLLEFK
jgi:Protein of unknown function (DUF3592)